MSIRIFSHVHFRCQYTTGFSFLPQNTQCGWTNHIVSLVLSVYVLDEYNASHMAHQPITEASSETQPSPQMHN
jgi:hypothetical protein